MTDNRREPTALWCGTSATNAVICALMWLGEGFLMLMFVKWALHRGPALYLLMIPWTLLGAIVFARPNWIVRMKRAVEEKAEIDMERLGKWTPRVFRKFVPDQRWPVGLNHRDLPLSEGERNASIRGPHLYVQAAARKSQTLNTI